MPSRSALAPAKDILKILPRPRCVLFLLLSLSACVDSRLVFAAENTAALNAARLSITRSDMQRHVDVLADDTFEGRAAGSRGGHAASVYLRRALAGYGLEPMGTDGDYFQYFRGNHRNVLAKIEGSDPDLKKEFILISAHYDHVGYGSRSNSFGPIGYIHNGADDNASGTAALLELAEALEVLGQHPRRSILIAFWDGEEQGLLGSKHFASHPSVPLDRIKLLINMDMVGRLRDNKLSVYGSRTVPDSRQLMSRLNADTGMTLDFNWEIKENSDHYPFFVRRIPYLMPHTGLHDDYHRPRDDAHKINSEGLEKIGRLLLEMVNEFANRDEVAAFRHRSRNENPSTARRLDQPLAPLPKRLGLAWQPTDDSPEGVLVMNVRYGTPAARAGILRGDRIVELAGRAVTSDNTMHAAVFGAANPVRVVVRRDGEEAPLELTAELAGRPLRLGMSWRADDGEPGSVIVNRVVPGSPAALAGLRVRDRIYEINGERFASMEAFGERIRDVAFPAELLIERRGLLQTLTMEPLPGDVPSEDAEIASF